MKTAEIVKYAYGDTSPRIKDPEHYTVIHAVKEYQERKRNRAAGRDAQRVASGRFNTIRGLDKLGR